MNNDNDDDAPLFRLFWENSKLNARTAQGFAERLDEDARTAPRVAQLFYPGASHALPRPTDPLAEVMRRRRSDRAFGAAPLDERQLGSLFHAFVHSDDGRRALPSAGGKYPIEVFAFLLRVQGPLAGAIVHYAGDVHGVTRVGTCPLWDELAGSVGLAVEGVPAALFVFAALPERATAKYGERGGRFLLLECGHYAQNLALRAAAEGLVGVATGGLHDDRVRTWLGLDRTGAMIPLGYACGAAVR